MNDGGCENALAVALIIKSENCECTSVMKMLRSFPKVKIINYLLTLSPSPTLGQPLVKEGGE